MMTLQELTDTAFRAGKSFIEENEPDEEVIPTFLTLNASGKVGVNLTPFFDDEQKEAVAIAMKHHFKKENVIAYCFVSEAWVIERDQSERKRNPGEMPSEAADRMECLTIIAQSATGEIINIRAEIKRSGNKRTVSEPEVRDTKGATLGGRFGNLLGEKQTVQ